MWVHLAQGGGGELATLLSAGCPPEVRLTVGPPRPDPAGYEVLVAGRPAEEDLRASPHLRAVVIPFAGVPPGTRELLRRHPHLAVANLHHNAAATAETAVALLLAAARRLVPADRALRQGDWRPRYAPDPSPTLSGRRGVVVGYGAVGSRVARALLGLGMSVDAVRRTPGGSAAPGVRLHAAERLDALLPGAAVIVLCAPLTDATRGLLDRRLLGLLGPDAVLVNVGRGELVEEAALYEALSTGRLGAAGIDVWWRYPGDEAERAQTPPSAFPFGALDNVVLSPHRAGHGADVEALRARALIDLLAALARGEPPPGRVDLERGY